MQAERIGSHFSHNGLINFISRLDCYICTDASVDTHIDATYIRHLSSLTSDIICKCQRWQKTDDGHKSHQYGCLQKRLCKCSNMVEKWNWLDHYVRNESQYAPLAYFPLYIFEISFIKWKRAGTHQKVELGFKFFFILFIWHRHNIPHLVFDIGGLFHF